MGRHHQQGTARRAHVSLGAATLAGLLCSATYALAAPAVAPAAPVAAPAAPLAVTTTCDLSGPPVFGDPAHPDEITNRACGWTDAQGRERSGDAWIDDQLRAAGR
ncbi:hypothetical protein [Actinomycetospora sp. NBRC 106378]|uniref:hypothetical protein n=1 Tax=Actinomycetospora sp. NBRC 106378 TaxID=3032208 RepID=UPI0024A37B51|nr:hypothetical protein [Actinomycetospora sp. NBRC 106378]GLZ51605.1 hypothetical protein Acsp07_12220 [Actinomycetospora sp. NBRC 106378]